MNAQATNPEIGRASERVLERIAKLLALAEGEGTTPYEAAAAAAAASRLMLKYNVTRAEAEGVELGAGEPIEQEGFWRGGRIMSWILILADGLARLHNCRMLVQAAARGAKDSAALFIVGRKSDVACVRYLYAYLSREIDRLATDADVPMHCTPRAYRNSFRVGAGAEVIRRLRVARQEHREEIQQTAEGSRALVHIDAIGEQVQRVTDQHATGKGSYGGANAGSSRAGLFAGVRAGEQIPLHDGIEGAPGSRALKPAT